MTGKQIWDALRTGKITPAEAREITDENLRKAGFVQAKPLFNWIEKEWLAKGLTMGAIEKRGDEYCFVYRETTELKVVGESGRTKITQEVRVKDTSAVNRWWEMYSAWRRENDNQTQQLDLEGIGTLVKSMKPIIN